MDTVRKKENGSNAVSDEEISSLLRGAYDLHIHVAPSPFKRMYDEFALAQAADKAGYAGILLKSHYESTAARAEVVNSHDGLSVRAYGALVLNQPAGGLNPYAVINALERGARIIFMPTRDAANSLVFGNMSGDFFDRPGITVLTERGTLKKEVYEIFDIVKAYDAALATGHLSPHESMILCKEGVARKVRMILTHPEFPRTLCPKDMQKELASMGVIIEHCWYCIADTGYSVDRMIDNIRAAGTGRCYISTDRGQADREPPVEGMKRFVRMLLEHGMRKQEIKDMLTKVPESVLTQEKVIL